MLIRLKEIEAAPLQLERSEPVTSFPELVHLSDVGELKLQSPVAMRLRAYLVSGMVEVEGHLELTVQVTCGRCLIPVTLPVYSNFALTYTSEPLSVVDDETEEEVELSAEEMNLIPFEGEEIDLTAQIQEQLLVALPIQTLCKEDCRGLCLQCGADLNRQPCSCEPKIFNSKFGALKNLKI